MPKCAVKLCKNNSKKVKKEDGISYFHFPVNLLQKEIWRKIIAQERREEFYKPNKSSVVCSDHFSESDMYYTTKGIRRLKQDAVLVVDMNEESEQINHVADSEQSQDRKDPLHIFPTEVETNSKTEASTSTVKREISPESLILHSLKKAALSQIPNITSEQRVISSPTSSELSSILDTPKTSFYKKAFRESNKKMQVKTKYIKMLQQQNRRLRKRNNRLKTIIQELKKKKRLLDKCLCNNLQQNKNESIILSILTAKKKKSLSKYPPALREFALTVNLYSPAAYKYLRSVFNNRLPHPNTMLKWYQNVNAQPGFTEEAMSRLTDKAKTTPPPVNL